MKNYLKKITLTALTGAVLTTSMSAFAVSDGQAKPFKKRVYLEGQQVYCWNAEGKQIDYLRYNNTTYVPVRTVGEWAGKTVSYDDASKSILLNGATDKVYRKQTDHAVSIETWRKQMETGMPVKIRDDMKLVVDGKQKTLKDAAGKEAYPINYNNTNYIPLPSAAELLGMTIKHPIEGTRLNIYMRTPLTEEQVAEGKAYIDALRKTYSYTALKAAGVELPAVLGAQRNLDVSGISRDPNAVDNEDSIFKLMHRSARDKNMSIDTIKRYAELSIEAINKMTALKKPDLAVLDVHYQNMLADAKEAIAACETVLKAVADGKDLKTCEDLMLISTTKRRSAYDACEFVTVAPAHMETVMMEE